MKLEAGMYVRTNEGYIGKIKWCCCTNEKLNIWAFSLDTVEQTLFSDSSLTKEPSFNPIDLIEVGDYVNGYKVSFKGNDYKPFIQCDYRVQEGTTNHYKFYEETIYSIVTKEQFNTMKYEVSK